MNNYYRHKLQNLEKAMETARDISCSACASKYWGYIPEIKKYECHNCGHTWNDDLKAHLIKPLYEKEVVLEE